MSTKRKPTRGSPAGPRRTQRGSRPGGAVRSPAGRSRAAGSGRRALPAGERFFTPGATGVRRAVERRSAAPLVLLYQLPVWVPPLVLVALLLVGLLVPGPAGALALLVVAAFVGWLGYLAWPSLPAAGRLGRVAAVAAVLAAAVAQAVR